MTCLTNTNITYIWTPGPLFCVCKIWNSQLNVKETPFQFVRFTSRVIYKTLCNKWMSSLGQICNGIFNVSPCWALLTSDWISLSSCIFSNRHNWQASTAKLWNSLVKTADVNQNEQCYMKNKFCSLLLLKQWRFLWRTTFASSCKCLIHLFTGIDE